MFSRLTASEKVASVAQSCHQKSRKNLVYCRLGVVHWLTCSLVYWFVRRAKYQIFKNPAIFYSNELIISQFALKFVVRNGLKMAGNGIKWLNCGSEMVESGVNVVGVGGMNNEHRTLNNEFQSDFGVRYSTFIIRYLQPFAFVF